MSSQLWKNIILLRVELTHNFFNYSNEIISLKLLLLLVLPMIGFSSAWAEVTVLNDQMYYGDDGSLHIVGEIQNNFNAPLNQIELQASLFSNGVLIDSVNSESLLNTIMPEMKSPFDFVILGDQAKYVDEYSLDIIYKISEPKGQVIDISETNFARDNFDNLVITGIVTNHGEITANMVVVIATLYDSEGNVAGVSKTQVEPDYLKADDDSFFLVQIPDKSRLNPIVDYSIVAQSEEYTAVPEFPLGSMILLASSVSVYVVLSRYSSKVITNLVSATGSR